MKKYWWMVVVGFIVLLGAGIWMGLKVLTPKIGYVDNNILYKEFKGKTDLEKEYMKEKGREQAYLDSLYLQLNVAQKRIGASSHDIAQERSFLEKKRAFEELTNSFENRNKELQSKYMDQIWTQINQYVKEYGKDNGYDFILGATGNGTIMHASEKNDISKDVLKYVNKRYDGK